MSRLFVAVLLMVLLIPITATTQEPDRPQVVASFSILGDVVAQVAGDAADVSVTIPADADPHSFEPTPGDLIAVAEADIVFVNGMFFEEGLLEAIENAGTDSNIINTSQCVPLMRFGDDDHDDDDHDDNDHSETVENPCAEYSERVQTLLGNEMRKDTNAEPLYAVECDDDGHNDAEDTDEHHHGTCDPHVWTVTTNVMYWVLTVRDALSELAPSNAETYAANAQAYLEELAALERDFVAPSIASIPVENRVLVTTHESLGYFAAAYDFEIIETIIRGGGTANEPSAAELARAIDQIRAANVPAIFSERGAGGQLAETVANETGAEVYTLYSGALSTPDGPAPTYTDYIRYNVRTIVEALGGNTPAETNS